MLFVVFLGDFYRILFFFSKHNFPILLFPSCFLFSSLQCCACFVSLVMRSSASRPLKLIFWNISNVDSVDRWLHWVSKTVDWDKNEDQANPEDNPECPGRGVCKSQYPHMGQHSPSCTRYSSQ